MTSVEKELSLKEKIAIGMIVAVCLILLVLVLYKGIKVLVEK